ASSTVETPPLKGFPQGKRQSCRIKKHILFRRLRLLSTEEDSPNNSFKHKNPINQEHKRELIKEKKRERGQRKSLVKKSACSRIMPAPLEVESHVASGSVRRHRHRRRPRWHRGLPCGCPDGMPHPAPDPQRGNPRTDVLQPRHRWHRQEPPGEGNRCPGRRHGPRHRPRRHPVSRPQRPQGP